MRRPRATALSLPALRLAAQQLTGPRLDGPAELVAWFGAIQAQDPAAARWAVGVRLAGRVTEAAVQGALAGGTILRTHALRGTWHLVAPADLRDLVALSAPRVLAAARTRHRQLGLDGPTVRRGCAVIARALRRGHASREALRVALERASISTQGARLSHLLLIAELQAIACSGAPVAGRPTWALLDERVPPRRGEFDRQAALARLALRYVRSRGPASAADLGWFAGLGLAEARAALEAWRGQRYGAFLGLEPALTSSRLGPGPGRPRRSRGPARRAR